MSFSKRLEDARKAFAERDMDGAAAAHTAEYIKEAAERHGGSSHQYIGEMVYGGLDGIITTFAVVSGVAGAALGTPVILILGLANLFADGFSMAIGAYLSAKSEQEYYEREWERESWEVENFPEGELLEMYEIYRQQGYTEEEAKTLVHIQSVDKDRWIRVMMCEELGMMEEDRNPVRIGGATLLSFVVAGAVPLSIYLLGLAVPVDPEIAFPISIVLSGAALFGLGAAKVLITKLNPIRSGLEMLGVGGVAAILAYAVGALLKGLGA